MIKKYDSGDLLALVTWFSVMSITMFNWQQNNTAIDLQTIELTPLNIAFVILLFILFFVGYLLTGDILNSKGSTGKNQFGLWFSIGIVVILSSIFHYGLVGILAIISVAQLPKFYRFGTVILLAWSIPIACAAIGLWIKDIPYMYENALLFCLFNSFAVLATYRVIAERKAKLKSEQLVRELKATQLLLSAASKRDERLRVARDLHDSLGHHLTALLLQLEIASHIKDDTVQKHIQQAKTIGATLLSEVRTTVSEFRQNQDFQLTEALQALCQNIPGLAVTLTINVDPSRIPALMSETIFRSIQEAITNLLKHSRADQCFIALNHVTQHLILTIRDNGKSTLPIKLGNGLKGMKERVAKLDGECQFNQTPNGFSVEILLPLPQEITQ